jgi:TolB-like protein/DNA-binding winged helix-turn-helix (wHTH) protein/Tfp pilus assembly protein PilF
VEGDFRLGSWLVQPSLNNATRNGTKRRLTPKAMQVLVCLADHAGEPLSKEKLIEKVWPDAFVGDDALKNLVAELRRVLDDDAKHPRIVETIQKRGYRLVAPVEWIDRRPVVAWKPLEPTIHLPAAADRKLWKPGWTILAGAAFALLLLGFNIARVQNWLRSNPAPQIHSIGVLPLRNLSADPNQEYLCDGLTDGLITDLAQIGSLKVISHTSTMQYRDTRKSLPEIARELNVDGLIEGTVQRSGDRIRITAQLIHGPTDKHLWANSYERDTRDIFSLESEVTNDIATQVQARVVVPTRAPRAQARSINPKALDAYLEGNYHMHQVAHGSVDEELTKAAGYFQQAIDADPNFAPAYLGLSDAVGSHLRDSAERAAGSKSPLEKAIELDPTSSEAWASLADVKLFYLLDWSGAEKDFRHAIALNPNNADAHKGLAQYLVAMGRVDEGWSEFQITQELDPNQEHLSGVLFARREYDRQIEVLLRWVERHSDDGDAYWNLYWAYTLKGMHKQAIEALARSVSLLGLPATSDRVQRAFAKSGYKSAMRTFAQELERLDAEKQAFLPGFTAEAYAVIGDKDRAFYWLEQAYLRRESGGREPGLVFIRVDPMLDPLRSDPRFKDLLRRVRLPQ